MKMRCIDKDYCLNDYWLDYPRQNRVKIDNTNLTNKEKEMIRNGTTITKPDRGGSYTQYYIPIFYDDGR